MTPFSRLRSWLRSFVHQQAVDREMDAELGFHVAARADDLVARGLHRDVAERQARREFGNPGQWKELGREARGLRLIDQVLADLRYGVRWLRRSPAFAVTAIVSIAIGIGANTAIFSLVDAVLLKAIPVSDPASLVLFSRSDATDGLGKSYPYPFCRELEHGDSPLAAVACVAGLSGPMVEVDGQAERVSGEMVSGGFFEMLGVTPHLGRLFTRDDNRVPGGHPVVVLSHGYWSRRFGGSPAVVGRSIRVNSNVMTVVGVAPPGFFGLELGWSPDIRMPMMMQAELEHSRSRLDSPEEWWLQIVGRLKPGVTREAATPILDSRYQRFSEALPPEWPRDKRLTLLDAGHGIRRMQARFGPPLKVLSGLAAILLLLVSLNVANLMIARAAARAREFALRKALGAGRARIATQLLVEASLLVAAGAAVGAAVAPGAARALAALALPATTAPIGIGIDVRVLLFTVAVSAIVAIVCGLVPALSAGRTAPVAALANDSRQVAGGRFAGRRLLVAAQIALSFVLLVGAGLLTRTLANLRAIDFGFDRENLLVVSISTAQARFTQPEFRAFFGELEKRVAAVPGVRSSSLAMMPLLGRGEWGSGLTLDNGFQDNTPGPNRNAVGAGYFRTIGTRVVAGREFTDMDTVLSQKVAVVNEAFARKYLDGQPIGRRIGTGDPKRIADITIVGVVADGNSAFVRETPAPFWYVPYRQLGQINSLTLHVRATADTETVAAAIRGATSGIDSRTTTFGATSMEARISTQIVAERILAGLSAAFGVFAILLAAIGLYGVTAYITAARTREIGIRIALGSTPAAILSLMLRQTAIVTVAGLGCGLLVALTAFDGLKPLLFGVEPVDPIVIGLAAVSVAFVTFVAAWLPARRAAYLDPMRALE